MPLKDSKFKLDDELSLVGNMMRVSGILQLEYPGEQIATRYLLTGGAGAPQILEERGNDFTLLRPFPPAAQPQASADSVTVMGEKYALAGVSKLKVLGTSGQAPGGAPAAPVLLSGKFEGTMGALVREIIPGAETQAFYSVKPVLAADVMSAEQIAANQAAALQLRAERAQTGAEAEEEGGSGKKIARFVIAILVVAGLAYACTGSDDSGSSSTQVSGSARSVSSGFHGK